MCDVTDLLRLQVQALPEEDRAALREFAQKRADKAADGGARMFWQSLVRTCWTDDEARDYWGKLNAAFPKDI